MSLRSKLENKRFQFDRTDGSVIGAITLNPDGTIGGIDSYNERFWEIEDNQLTFKNAVRERTTVFTEVIRHEAPHSLIGTFLPGNKKHWHRLTELAVSPAMIADLKEMMFGLSGDAFDILKCAELAAGFDSANYYSEHMTRAKPFPEKFSLLTDSMQNRAVEGLILEFGVFSGATVNHIARHTEQTVYGFDTFSGLPEQWRPGFSKGVFKVEKLPSVLPNVELVVGLFENTLAAFLDRITGNVSLLHIDCDLYSSTKTVFRELTKRIVPGTVIIFDEYFNYPGWRQHEFKAFHEYIDDYNREYRYHSFVRSHQQVAVQIVR